MTRVVPIHLREVLGEDGKRGLADLESLPDSSIPAAPGHLGETAAAEWRRVAPLLAEMGLLVSADTATLEAYCISYGRCMDVEAAIAALQLEKGRTDGLLQRTPNGYAQISPLLSISSKMTAQMYRFAKALGLSPEARVKVEKQMKQRPKTGTADPLEKMLSGGKRLGKTR